ncbi:MAG: hypothetical protein KDJ38_10720 [Gammaproteobacteria bacterium]|nr:hypothetical protein [Gammaproteobacteria bacterium]
MTGYLSVSRAAKLVGASRSEIQKKIRKGELETFEGEVSEIALKSAYPQVRLEDNSEIERLQRLKSDALNKSLVSTVTDEQLLKSEILRLRHALHESTEQVRFYQRLTGELKGRLITMQADCTHQQKTMLRALLSWMSLQIRQNRH